MKFTKKEIIYTLILSLVSFLGHYYLSWHCTLSAEGRYIGKFIWISSMVGIGYLGLTDNEVSWVSQLWLIVNCLLMLGFGIDKLLVIHYQKVAFFRISSYQFTSPIPYIGACCIPRLFVSQFRKHKHRSSGGVNP